MQRCVWAGEMWDYHDTEWGLPTHDFLVLEGAQAGLSWSTILNKRAGYRKHFAEFDPEEVARFTPVRVNKILQDPAIVRNRMKVESCVKNARRSSRCKKSSDRSMRSSGRSSTAPGRQQVETLEADPTARPAQ